MANTHHTLSAAVDRPSVRAGVVALLQQKSPLCLAAGAAIYAAGLAQALTILLQCVGQP